MKKIFVIVILALVVSNLCACGKMSAPVPIEGSGYPHTYPKQ